MRIILALPLLAVAACSVEKDAANDSTTLEYDQERVENTAEDVGNVVSSAGKAIQNEVGDLAADSNEAETNRQ